VNIAGLAEPTEEVTVLFTCPTKNEDFQATLRLHRRLVRPPAPEPGLPAARRRER
jgi:hypothetical protein